MRICFVVHRAAPYPGGSEIYVQALAEECWRRGHETWIFAGEHQGDHSGIRISSDPHILQSGFDLLVVHAGNKGAQSYVLEHSADISAPILYLTVTHEDRSLHSTGLKNADFLGYSTTADFDRIVRFGAADRAVRIRHGIDAANSRGITGFRAKHGIAADRRMFISCGGYWPHKRMKQLARLFSRLKSEAILVTTGYRYSFWHMPRKSDAVLPLLIDTRAEVLSAIREADCYIMHSAHEGFGLVLLESMLNETPWLANDTGGAEQLGAFGSVYRCERDLEELIVNFKRNNAQVASAAAYVRCHHLISHSVDDILEVAENGLPKQA